MYGGGSIGLMGLVSQAVHEAGGHVLGYALSISDFFTLALCPSLFHDLTLLCDLLATSFAFMG